MGRLHVGGKFLKFKPANPDDLRDFVHILQQIDKSFDENIVLDSKTQIKDLSVELATFLDKHSVQRHYMFSLKKCEDVNCVCGPVRLHNDVFRKLHHLPDPKPCPSNPEKWVSCTKVVHVTSVMI